MAKATVSRSAAALYLRKSTEKQERSIDDQRAELIRFAASKGYKVVREYVDEGISGDRTDKRAGFLQMRDDAAKGAFGVILSWDLDRFGRFDPIEAGHWIFPIRSAGVKLETVAQGLIDWDDFAGRISYFVQQEAKHSFLKDLSRNVCRAQLAMAREGKGTGGNRLPFGYRAHKVRDERGKLIESRLVVEPEHAAIVRRIFETYIGAGGSLRQVAQLLNSEGVPTPTELQGLRLQTARKWSIGTIKGILSNRKLTGAFVWGVKGVGAYHTTCMGEITTRRKADGATKGKPIIHDDAHEAIVDRQTFDRVQTLLDQRKRRTARRNVRQYLLSGLLRCGDCGGPMVGVWHKVADVPSYMCVRYAHSGKAACHCNTIREMALVDTIVRLIQERYLSRQAIDRLREAIRDEQAKKPDVSAAEREVKAKRRRIQELDRIIGQGAERILSVAAELVPIIAAKLEEHRAERERLEGDLRRLEAAQTRPEPASEKEVDAALAVLRGLHTALKKAGPIQTRELLAAMVDRIELRFDHRQNGKIRRSEFRCGTIYLRPDVGGSILSAKGLLSEHERRLTFTAEDLRRFAA